MRTITLAIAGLLLFSGCSSDPQPIEPNATRTTPKTAPTLPPDATPTSLTGRIEFVRHVIRTLNYSANSGDSAPLKRLVLPGCEGCDKYIAEVEESNKDRGRILGFDWRVTRGTAEGNSVEATIKAAAYDKEDPANGSRSHVAAATYELGFRLSRQDHGWVVRELYLPDDSDTQ